jgi:glycosyltransferase involved in cell wall biosynthesis
MKRSQGIVSVVLPAFNAGELVVRAIESALIQNEVGEIIVVDDGSLDDTLRFCEKFARSGHIRLLKSPAGKNFGVSFARNLAIAATSLPVIGFLDADDFYLPARFAYPIRLMREHAVDGVYEAVQAECQDNAAIAKWLTKSSTFLYGLKRNVDPENLFEALLLGHYGHFHTTGLTVRRDIFQRCGLFAQEFRLAQDSLMWLRMAAVGTLIAGRLFEPVSVRYIHVGNRCFVDPTQKDQVALNMLTNLLQSANELRLNARQRELLVLKRVQLIDRVCDAF